MVGLGPPVGKGETIGDGLTEGLILGEERGDDDDFVLVVDFDFPKNSNCLGASVVVKFLATTYPPTPIAAINPKITKIAIKAKPCFTTASTFILKVLLQSGQMLKYEAMIYLVLLATLVFRLIALNQSLWLDEAINVNVARSLSFKSLIFNYSLGDFHPPLYHLIFRTWILFFSHSFLLFFCINHQKRYAYFMVWFCCFNDINALQRLSSLSVNSSVYSFSFNKQKIDYQGNLKSFYPCFYRNLYLDYSLVNNSPKTICSRSFCSCCFPCLGSSRWNAQC